MTGADIFERIKRDTRLTPAGVEEMSSYAYQLMARVVDCDQIWARVDQRIKLRLRMSAY